MAVTLLDLGCAVDLGHLRPLRERGGVSPEAHGPALVVVQVARHWVVALNPFLEVIDHRLKPLAAGLVIELL